MCRFCHPLAVMRLGGIFRICSIPRPVARWNRSCYSAAALRLSRIQSVNHISPYNFLSPGSGAFLSPFIKYNESSYPLLGTWHFHSLRVNKASAHYSSCGGANQPFCPAGTVKVVGMVFGISVPSSTDIGW